VLLASFLQLSGDKKSKTKQDVGHRLALLARDISYGDDIEDSGPLFRQAVSEGAQMRIGSIM